MRIPTGRPEALHFTDSDQIKNRGRTELAAGIFSPKSERWGPGSGVFMTRWAIPRDIYTESAYAGANYIDPSEEFREHGIYGFDIMNPLASLTAGLVPSWVLPAAIGGVLLYVFTKGKK